ncbi:MAG: GNAT family N-acetyltransferase [Deltaproteobacteria bacterium]|nr:GNAT family N-acetyltransferase [Deltaproteobacteria bacterium]
MTVEIRALRTDDDRRSFQSGDEDLDRYFHRYAGQNQFRHHIGVTYVAVERSELIGFVTVSPATLDADDLPGGRRMPPYPIPVLRVARLAVGKAQQGRGLGRALLRFALELAEKLRDEVGCVGLVVDAKLGAVEFYRRYGFVPLDASEGRGAAGRPAPAPMFVALGSVPPPSSRGR